MTLRNTTESWGWLARVLHWVVAAIILYMLALGVYMVRLDDIFARFALTQTHKSWGFVVFTLACVRLAWRLVNRAAPRDPPDMKPWERALARGLHWGFYALMVALPLSGWLMASASPLQDSYGIKNMVFGVFEMPDPFIPGDKATEAAFKLIHNGAAIALALMLTLHVGAALKHHFVLRDDVLKRMTFGR
jgi:cytochrome b561